MVRSPCHICCLPLQVLYDERSESAAGPFFVEAKLAGQRGQHVMATGSGQARSKQQAKQVGWWAAALLCVVLDAGVLSPQLGQSV